MINQRVLLNKTVILVILFLFIGTSIIPSICGDYNNEQNTISLTFYTFDRTGTKECKVEISADTANIISDMFEELKYKITNDPISDETKILKNEFIETLDRYNLIPKKISKNYVYFLLNPNLLQNIVENNPNVKQDNIGSRIRNDILPGLYANSGSSFFCSMAGGGYGLLFTPIILPRPRLASIWSSFINAHSGATNLITGSGFIASGPQFGIAFGFIGIGLNLAYPGQPASFGFIGYALLTFVQADDVETYTLN